LVLAVNRRDVGVIQRRQYLGFARESRYVPRKLIGRSVPILETAEVGIVECPHDSPDTHIPWLAEALEARVYCCLLVIRCDGFRGPQSQRIQHSLKIVANSSFFRYTVVLDANIRKRSIVEPIIWEEALMRRQRVRVRFLCRCILIVATVTAALSFEVSVLSGEPVVGAMSFHPASTRPEGSFSANFSGTNLTDETYFDIRFQSPNGNSDQVVLNWQLGTAAAHSVPPDTVPGIWKITGVRAHESSSVHGGPFISISIALTVSSLIVTELQFDPGSVESEGSFTATFSGTNLTSETYFDVRFRAPCSDVDQVVLNWQKGASATHRVPAGSPTGAWTISGIWAHEAMTDHSTDFDSRSTALLVYQQSAVPFSGKVTSIAVDPSRSATVYAATIGSGLYKTCDGGQAWMASSAGLPDTDILTLALDPASPWIVYAGTSIGVFKSVNGGVSWNTAGADLSSTPIRALAIDPRRPATIYAATENSGVFKSVDGALRWSVAGTGLPAAATVQSLAIDPVNSDIIYAGTHALYPAFAQIFKSTDGGGHWDFIFAHSETMSALVVDPKNPFVIYAGTFNPDRGNHNEAGVFKSTNGGQFWYGLWSGSGANYELAQPGHRLIESLVIDPVNSAVLYAGGKYPLVYKSKDAGASWTRSEVGDLSNSDIQALAIDPSKPSTIYAGAQEGIFKSTNAGATWQPLDIH
jgi:photosystem II stability/assembly factor-like uncharacterized protein